MVIYSGFSHEKLWFSIAMLVYQRVIFVEFPHPPSKITKVPIVGSARSPFSKAPAKRQRPGAPKKLLFLLSVDEIYCLYVVFQWLCLFWVNGKYLFLKLEVMVHILFFTILFWSRNMTLASKCPTLVFTAAVAMGCWRLPSCRLPACRAPTSMGSPNGVPVPWHSMCKTCVAKMPWVK